MGTTGEAEDRSQTSEQAAAAFRIWLDLSLKILGG